MTTATLSETIGRDAMVRVEGQFMVPMRIIDAKTAYGNVRYLVEPTGGSGREWVDAKRVQVQESPQRG